MGTECSLPHSQVSANCPWAISIQSSPPKSNLWTSILILSCHLFLGLLSGLSPSGFLTSVLPHTCYMPRPFHSSRIMFYAIVLLNNGCALHTLFLHTRVSPCCYTFRCLTVSRELQSICSSFTTHQNLTAVGLKLPEDGVNKHRNA